MIKCSFFDVASIKSNLSKSEFDESKIEQLADLILLTGGLLRPLILKETGLGFTIIEGHLEYYAVVRAREKNPRQAEMVNAFMVDEHIAESAIEQIALLSGVKPTSTVSPTNVSVSIEQLTAIIAQQLSPITQRLDQQDRTLASIRQPQVEKVTPPIEVLVPQLIITPEIVEVISPAKQETETVVVKPGQTGKKIKTATKKKVELDPSIDPMKASSTLNLINTLNAVELELLMKRCKITSAAKLATNIINQRSIQPNQQFDSWETVIAQVAGLAATTAKNIIDKLR